jgi:beta-phosphoglucomutase
MKAVIFDMDGVIVDNNAYHKKAWQQFCGAFRITLDEGVWEQIYGRNNHDTLNILFHGKLNDQQINAYAEEKETMYRNLYAQHIEPVSGFLPFIDSVKKSGLRIALASSSGRENIDFIIDRLSVRNYFDVITDPESIRNGKPHPEIYLKTADLLKLRPDECVVFEDSLSGIESAHRAGMKVIGITTTHAGEEMRNTEFVMPDFSGILSDPRLYFPVPDNS